MAAGSPEHEAMAFEHAFLEAEIDAFARAVESLRADGAGGTHAVKEIERRIHRVEAILELHAARHEEQWLDTAGSTVVPAPESTPQSGFLSDVVRTGCANGDAVATTVGETEMQRRGSRMAETPMEIPDPSRSRSRTASTPFVVRERVRWSDVDAAGIVCYGMYLRFFELAESELFRTVGLPVRTLSGTHGLWLVRRRIECDFLQPASLDEELEVSVHVAAIGRTSLELAFRVVRVGETAPTATGRYVLVAVDRESLQPLPVPEPIQTALEPYRLSEAPRSRR